MLSKYSSYMEWNLLSCVVWVFFWSPQSPDQQRPLNTTEWDEISVWASLILSMTSAEYGRYSKDQTYSLGIFSEHLKLPRALELCLVFVWEETQSSVMLVCSLWDIGVGGGRWFCHSGHWYRAGGSSGCGHSLRKLLGVYMVDAGLKLITIVSTETHYCCGHKWSGLADES